MGLTPAETKLQHFQTFRSWASLRRPKCYALCVANKATFLTLNQQMKVQTDPSAKLRGYAQRIKCALHSSDRNAIQQLDDQLLWFSPFETDLEHLSTYLVQQQLLTAIQRTHALQMLEPIDNPSYSERRR